MTFVDNFQDFITYHAEAAGMTREEYMAVLMSEAKKKPGPDPYHRGLEDGEVEDKEDQIKKQADMDDDDPDAYKEMPGDEEAREKGEVKTSKATKSYNKLYGEDLDEGVMSNIHLLADASKDFEDFKKKFKKDYKKVFQNTPDFMDWLYNMYKDMAPLKAGERVEESQAHDEMAYGQLERIIDYATMLRERYDNGFMFDPWMHSKITKAKSDLNSVFDALDGGDGVVEGKVNETAMGYDAMTGLFYMEGVPFTQQRLEQVLNWLKGTTVKAGKTLPKQFTYKPAIEVEDSVSGNEITVDTDKIDYLKSILKRFKGKLANDGEFNEFDESKVEETQKQWKHIKKFNMNEGKFSPLGYAKRVISGEITLKDAMKEAGISLSNISKLIKKLDKGFDIDTAIMAEAVNPVHEADDTEQKSTDRGPLDDDKIETALKKKAEDTGVPIGIIRAVMRRGLAAWKSGHRPGANQQQWGYARVNAFLTKGEGTWGKADKDLAKEVRDGGHDKKLKKA